MFNVVFETPGTVVAQPWSPYLPESKDLIGDWLPPMSCGNYDVVKGKLPRHEICLIRNRLNGVGLTAEPAAGPTPARGMRRTEEEASP